MYTQQQSRRRLTDALTTRYSTLRTREFSWTRPTSLPPPPNIMHWRQHKSRATRKSTRCFDYCPIVTPERFILMFSQVEVGSLKIDHCFYCCLIWPGNLYALTRNLFYYNCDLVFSSRVSIILNGRRDHRHVILIRKIAHIDDGGRGGDKEPKNESIFLIKQRKITVIRNNLYSKSSEIIVKHPILKNKTLTAEDTHESY